MLSRADLRRLNYGYFVRPADEAGGQPRVEPVLGYLLRHPEGLLLFDTGIGAHPEVDEHYRITRRPVDQALKDAGIGSSEVRVLVNCHLHFDHCGGNPCFPSVPIVVQTGELAAAGQPGYTLAELVDFTRMSYQQIDGEVELLPDRVLFAHDLAVWEPAG